MKILLILCLATCSAYAQEVRCSYVFRTVGYIYDTEIGNYRETVTSIDRVKMCAGSETIAIGAKTTFYLGNAIDEVNSKKDKRYRLHATNESHKTLTLEMWYPNEDGAKMYIKAIYPEYFIVYFIE
jgi:hypothetical protein